MDRAVQRAADTVHTKYPMRNNYFKLIPREPRNSVPRRVSIEAFILHPNPKAALLEEARPLPEQDLKRFREQTDEGLADQAHDPWNVVAGKAKSLRDLGRTEEAVRAYAAYAEMFAADPTAERFCKMSRLMLQIGGGRCSS